MNDFIATINSADLEEAAREAAAEHARQLHAHLLRRDHEYALDCLRDACDDRAALLAAIESALRVCAEAADDEQAGHSGAALGALVAIAATLRGVAEDCRETEVRP